MRPQLKKRLKPPTHTQKPHKHQMLRPMRRCWKHSRPQRPPHKAPKKPSKTKNFYRGMLIQPRTLHQQPHLTRHPQSRLRMPRPFLKTMQHKAKQKQLQQKQRPKPPRPPPRPPKIRRNSRPQRQPMQQKPPKPPRPPPKMHNRQPKMHKAKQKSIRVWR